jgi:hypothetical protein
VKRNCVLVFCTAELYWEFGRFVPYIIFKREKEYKTRSDVDFIVMTKEDRFDIYGKHASIFVPFRLKNEKEHQPNCFKLDGITDEEYSIIIKTFQQQFQDRYNILETIYPKITKNEYLNKNQFSKIKCRYNYIPRIENSKILLKYLDNKPVIVLAPRYREGFKRNWPHWNELYNLIWNNEELKNKYTFIICGKSPDYIPDVERRFLDINYMDQNVNSSLIGLTMECMKRAVLTVGSQSAIPNISLLFSVPALEWGHQKHLHTVTYNVLKTKVTFLEDLKYNINPKEIYQNMIEILRKR